MHLSKFGTELRSPTVIRKEGKTCYLNFPVEKGGFLTIAAEWCGYCKDFAPIMKEARDHYGFKSFYMDGDREAVKAHMEKLGCSGFPSVYQVMPSGRLVKYQGERTKKELGKAYVESQRVMAGGYGCQSKQSPVDFSLYQVRM